MMKIPYVCGPIRELSLEERPHVLRFYEKIADVCETIARIRPFVPHQRFDPDDYVSATPQDIYRVEYDQVCNKTSLLIVVAVAPSWGGGMEVQMANTNRVPIVLLCEREKLKSQRISRLLLGSPALMEVIEYDTQDEAIDKLKAWIINLWIDFSDFYETYFPRTD